MLRIRSDRKWENTCKILYYYCWYICIQFYMGSIRGTCVYWFIMVLWSLVDQKFLRLLQTFANSELLLKFSHCILQNKVLNLQLTRKTVQLMYLYASVGWIVPHKPEKPCPVFISNKVLIALIIGLENTKNF